jgi:hypothetical protein
MRIHFLYSFAQGPVQLHDREMVIEIEGDTAADGDPSHAQLAEAERKFLAWFADNLPGSYLLRYVSGPAGGSKDRYSEYQAYLPA